MLKKLLFALTLAGGFMLAKPKEARADFCGTICGFGCSGFTGNGLCLQIFGWNHGWCNQYYCQFNGVTGERCIQCQSGSYAE